MTVQYYMRGFYTPPLPAVGYYINWTSPNFPDPTGSLLPSPYHGNTTNITINDSITTPDPYPTGQATGDLGGQYPGPTVVKIEGIPVPVPTINGTVLTYNSGNFSWTTPSSGGSSFTANGDLSGSSTYQQVIQITSATGRITFSETNSNPNISQTTRTTNSGANNISITSQNAYASATGSNQQGGSASISAGRSSNGNQGAGLLLGGASNTPSSTSSELVIDILNIYDTVTPRPDLRFVLNTSYSPSFYPGMNNQGTLGTSSNCWANIYTNTIVIGSTLPVPVSSDSTGHLQISPTSGGCTVNLNPIGIGAKNTQVAGFYKEAVFLRTIGIQRPLQIYEIFIPADTCAAGTLTLIGRDTTSLGTASVTYNFTMLAYDMSYSNPTAQIETAQISGTTSTGNMITVLCSFAGLGPYGMTININPLLSRNNDTWDWQLYVEWQVC